MDYKNSGVDVEAGYRAVDLIRGVASKTHSNAVISNIGGFGGMFSIARAKEMEEPVLVSGTDGVGTKLKVAFVMDKHDTIGIDCVAMCLNDIVCCGAEPLFFLDYIACGKIVPEKIESIVKGISEGCEKGGVSLIGGETAEMPGFYKESEYDLAGFAVGIVDKKNIIDGSEVKAGDAIIGIASSGIHSNGYSLVRKVFRPSSLNINEFIGAIGCELGQELIKPTKIYVKSILELSEKLRIKGIANITGGGFIENIPRTIPKGLCAKINQGSWEILPIFNMLQEAGDIKTMEMFNTFNMGVGMVLIVDRDEASEAIRILEGLSERAYIIGEIKEASGDVSICFE